MPAPEDASPKSSLFFDGSKMLTSAFVVHDHNKLSAHNSRTPLMKLKIRRQSSPRRQSHRSQLQLPKQSTVDNFRHSHQSEIVVRGNTQSDLLERSGLLSESPVTPAWWRENFRLLQIAGPSLTTFSDKLDEALQTTSQRLGHSVPSFHSLRCDTTRYRNGRSKCRGRPN